MQYHKIEIDEDIYQYLKKKAEPFVDTPNSVLRRELLGNNTQLSVKDTEGKKTEVFPQLPPGMPSALQQILEVAHLVNKKRMDRRQATKLIAHRREITYQSVIDKLTRQIGIKAFEFDRLLGEADLAEFIARLKRKFPRFAEDIHTVLS